MKIVLSYRRSDTAGVSGRIFDRLHSHFGQGSVFMDVDSIPFGVDFRRHIQKELEGCDVLLAIIGPRWLGGGKGQRIRDETDFVRLEIETALQRDIPVLPVLVDGAKMPKPSQLPEPLRDLTFRNAAEVESGRDFHPHLDRVIRSLDRLLRESQEQEARQKAEQERLALEQEEAHQREEQERVAREQAEVCRKEQEDEAYWQREERARLAYEEEAWKREEQERTLRNMEAARQKAELERAERGRLVREQEEARQKAEQERFVRELEEVIRKSGDKKHLAQGQAEARHKAEQERVVREQEQERLAREEEARQTAEKARLAREQEDTRRKAEKERQLAAIEVLSAIHNVHRSGGAKLEKKRPTRGLEQAQQTPKQTCLTPAQEEVVLSGIRSVLRPDDMEEEQKKP